MAFLLLAGTAGVRAQQCDVPQIGAQVFVEPGQTPEDIDGFFRLLHDNGMKVARIRMFGAHMYRGGEWDFSLYESRKSASRRSTFSNRMRCIVHITAEKRSVASSYKKQRT